MSSEDSNSESSGDICDSSVESYNESGNRGPISSPTMTHSSAPTECHAYRPHGQIGILPMEGRQMVAVDNNVENDSDDEDGDELLVDFPTRRQQPKTTEKPAPIAAFAKLLLHNKNKIGQSSSNNINDCPEEPPQKSQSQQQRAQRQLSPRFSAKAASFNKQKMNATPSNTVHVRLRGGGGSNRDLMADNEAATSIDNGENKKQHQLSNSSSFQSLLLAASIENAHDGSIFVMSFSPNGKYLATAGEDGKILVWNVSPQRNKHTSINLSQQHGNIFLRASGSAPLGTEVQLLSSQPIAIFEEHQAEVVGLSWSKQQAPGSTDPFLLSASLDKTVRLWHVSRPGALHIFQHADMVTCVDFHPTNDSYFISGGFDLKLRCWSIPNGRVKAWAQTPDIITAAQYSPNGNMVAAGLMKGQVYFYMTDGMKYYTQLESKNRRGRASDGRKVTGLMFRVNVESGSKQNQHRRCTSSDSNSAVIQAVGTPDRLNSSTPTRGRTFSDQSSLSYIGGLNAIGSSRRWQEHLLVTTNDSRLRLYEMDGFCAIQKYKGVLNTKMQIKATFSESGELK
jgi:WD40 repeat protein